TWNEIKTRAAAFVHEWRDEAYERGEAQTFWNQFFHVFGVNRRRLASFEQGVKKLSGRQGFIDLLWPGVLLVEHKSRGEDLDAVFRRLLGRQRSPALSPIAALRGDKAVPLTSEGDRSGVLERAARCTSRTGGAKRLRAGRGEPRHRLLSPVE